jgi:c-di-GMP-binding flagellar brake protein YcgR
MPTPHMGDRRTHMRFEVLGMMSASLLSTETLRVLNLGVSGALVEGALPLPPNAEYRMQLVLESHVSEATVKIRRVTEIGRESGSLRYRIGLEFLAISSEAEEAISRIVTANQPQP